MSCAVVPAGKERSCNILVQPEVVSAVKRANMIADWREQ